jgi:hypothetical protein
VLSSFRIRPCRALRLNTAQHPEYVTRETNIDAYREALYARYPQVCDDCLPLVEEELEKKEQMARTSALGEWLKGSKGKGKGNVAGARPREERHRDEVIKSRRTMVLWRARGILWVSETVVALIGHARGKQGFVNLLV